MRAWDAKGRIRSQGRIRRSSGECARPGCGLKGGWGEQGKAAGVVKQGAICSGEEVYRLVEQVPPPPPPHPTPPRVFLRLMS